MSFRSLVAFFTVLASLLAGCTTLSEGRKIDYKSTRTLPPLEVPPDLSGLPAEKGTTASTATFSEHAGTQKKLPAPGESAVLPEFADMRIAREGQVRWLVMKGGAEEAWPRLREFVLANGMIVARESSQTGVIETDWAENRAKVGTGGQRLLARWLGTLYSTGTRDRFRLRLDRGREPGTVEIYVTHQAMEEVVTQAAASGGVEQTKWQPAVSDPQLEAEMLRLVMIHFGAKEEQAKTVVAGAAARPAAERARLSRSGEGATFLSLEESLERAWRRVGLTLDRVGFTVEDRDRSRWTYYIRYVDPDKKTRKAEEDEYRIHLRAAEAGTVVEVLDREGAPAGATPGERILGLLHEQLK
jgi:outer membrane protein assembly factor BamC